MKKKLSLVLVASMLLTMSPAFAVNAADGDWTWDGDYTTINDVQEYVQFVGEINAGTYSNKADHKVAADLDLSAYDADDVVIKKRVGDLALDFQGHTVSGIVRNVTVSDHVGVGLIADKAASSAEVINLKLKDCSLTVNSTESWNDPQVSAVFGWSDRAYVQNLELENVTIKLTGAGKGFVGSSYGHHQWDNFRPDATNITMNNVLIDAPNALVGYVGGRIDGDAKITVGGLSINDTTIIAREAVTDESYAGVIASSNVSLTAAEDASLSVSLVDDATGYHGTVHTPVVDESTAVEPTVDTEGKAADTVCEEGGELLAVGETIPAKTPDNGETPDNGDDEQTPDNDKKEENKPAQTGDAAIFAVVATLVALLGAAIVLKKRHTAE